MVLNFSSIQDRRKELRVNKLCSDKALKIKQRIFLQQEYFLRMRSSRPASS